MDKVLTMTWYSSNVIARKPNWFLLLHGPGLVSIDGSVFIIKGAILNNATSNNNQINAWGK